MISSFRQRFFRVRYEYENPLDRQRAQVLLVMDWALIAGMIVWLVSVLGRVLGGNEPLELVSIAAPLLVLPSNLIIYVLIQTGNLRLAQTLFVGFQVILAILLTVVWGSDRPGINGTAMMLATLPLIAAGVLLNNRGIVIVALIMTASVIVGALIQSQDFSPQTLIPAEYTSFDLSVALVTIALAVFFLTMFTGNLQQIAAESLSTVRQQQWITKLGIELSNSQDERALLTHALDTLRINTRHVFTQIYLLDESGQLKRSGTRQDVGRGVLSLSEINILNQAIRLKQPITISNQDRSEEKRSHLRPLAQHGVAVPVVLADKVLGVLDIQSSATQPFSTHDIETLVLFASELSAALVHTRNINSLRQSLQEQEALSARLQAQIAAMLRREHQGISSTWNTYLQGRGENAIGFDVEADSSVIPAADIPESLRSTLDQGEFAVTTTGDEQTINVPIRFRDQMLGAMTFALPADQKITQRQLDMAQVVAERLALALENTRLFEQSQARVLRERKASEIAGVLFGATDVSAVLQLAAENFNEALGAVRTRIYLQPQTLAEPLADREDVDQ